MLLDFHDRLRAGGIPVSITEWLTLMGGLEKQLGVLDLDAFYHFARLCLVKNEALYDRFDQIFRDYWSGREQAFEEWTEQFLASIPGEWLRSPGMPELTDAQRAQIEALGGWDKLMQTLAERLAEQNEAHHGGSKWIGTGGTSPFGSGGFNPEGIRIGDAGRRQGRAVKVWEERRYKDLDGNRELGTRNFKMALRKLRKLAREGRPDTLDLESTVRGTAEQGGLLDLHMQAERRNTVKVLLLIDIGGSMDYHAELTSRLFSAARAEFTRLDTFWFHNFVYESLWRENRRRRETAVPTTEVIRTYGRDYRLIIVGDATMGPYEIMTPGGSVEHWNEEAGAVWLQRLLKAFPHCVWLNPEDRAWWQRTPSVRVTEKLMGGRMHPLTVDGIQGAIDTLKTPLARNAAPLAP
ncbi:MAG: VWA domain-containing protein [Gammaproteobacteria bacterium]|nr:MAG: VWA domain-containing protein [Gammaproteobacteria bacterium]PIE37878.1 MAG: VWA domain-containing protein [Gammaproteobacteria bacterium]